MVMAYIHGTGAMSTPPPMPRKFLCTAVECDRVVPSTGKVDASVNCSVLGSSAPVAERHQTLMPCGAASVSPARRHDQAHA
jgi:hypothetical protein